MTYLLSRQDIETVNLMPVVFDTENLLYGKFQFGRDGVAGVEFHRRAFLLVSDVCDDFFMYQFVWRGLDSKRPSELW